MESQYPQFYFDFSKLISSSSVVAEKTNNPIHDAPSAQPKRSNRCNHISCNKKLGLLGFSCRCGETFCPSHRHADTHDCKYDYKKEAMKQLSSTLVKVSGSKLEKL